MVCNNKKFQRETIFIIGAGHFGERAARLLSPVVNEDALYVVDLDGGSLSNLDNVPLKKIKCDGIDFLVENYECFDPENIVVPAVPVHLACEWLKRFINEKYIISVIRIPGELRDSLPYTWNGSEGSLLVSYANFTCPDDCPEPEYCTVSGEKRDHALFELLRTLDTSGFSVHVIRSRQLAPGLGGYSFSELSKLAEKVSRGKSRKWLICTSCKCHGIVTAVDVKQTG